MRSVYAEFPDTLITTGKADIVDLLGLTKRWTIFKQFWSEVLTTKNTRESLKTIGED